MDNRDVEYSNKRLKGFAKALYVGMLMATLVVAIGSIAVGETRDLVLTLPIIVILAMTMFTDRHIVHIPPLIIMMMCATFFISVLGRFLVDGTVVMMIVNFLVGVNFGLLGLILVYMLLKSMPGVRNENQIMVLLFMMSVSVSMYILMRMLQYYIANVWTEIEGIGLNDLMNETLMVILSRTGRRRTSRDSSATGSPTDWSSSPRSAPTSRPGRRTRGWRRPSSRR